jgi:hypothetical protein
LLIYFSVGFSHGFQKEKFQRLTKKKEVNQDRSAISKAFDSYIYKIAQHPYLACYADEDLAEELEVEKDIRLDRVVQKILAVMWANGVSFPGQGDWESSGFGKENPPLFHITVSNYMKQHLCT